MLVCAAVAFVVQRYEPAKTRVADPLGAWRGVHGSWYICQRTGSAETDKRMLSRAAMRSFTSPKEVGWRFFERVTALSPLVARRGSASAVLSAHGHCGGLLRDDTGQRPAGSVGYEPAKIGS